MFEDELANFLGERAVTVGESGHLAEELLNRAVGRDCSANLSNPDR